MTDHKLKNLAYYRTGGTCKILFLPKNILELQNAIKQIERDKLPYFYLGAGSNSLVMDTPWPGAVISFAKMRAISVRGNTLVCEAGLENSEVAKTAQLNLLSGAEWMYRLPGQIGGTVRMNARCYGGEISTIVRKIYTVDSKGALHEFYSDPKNKNVFRGYKDTIFMDSDYAIAKVEIDLVRNEFSEEILNAMLFCENDRLSKHQFDYPTCGCIFKNNYANEVSISSGFLLEQAGAKGLSVGNAHVNPYHCNFVYNKGANSQDILELSLKMRELVWREFGVWLEYEMELLGRIPQELKLKIEEKRDPNYQTEKLSKVRQLFQIKKKRSS